MPALPSAIDSLIARVTALEARLAALEAKQSDHKTTKKKAS